MPSAAGYRRLLRRKGAEALTGKAMGDDPLFMKISFRLSVGRAFACPRARQQGRAALLQMPERCSAGSVQNQQTFFGSFQSGRQPSAQSVRRIPACEAVSDLFPFHRKSPPVRYIVPDRRDVCECVRQPQLPNTANWKLQKRYLDSDYTILILLFFGIIYVHIIR